MKILFPFAILLAPTSVFGLAIPGPKASVAASAPIFSSASSANANLRQRTEWSNKASNDVTSISKTFIPAATILTTALPANAAAAATIPSALWAYGHYVSIIAIFGCLAAERTIVKAGMTEEEENTVVKLDLIYGLMAALL